MPYRILCNDVRQEGVKANPGLVFGLFCYVPLHKIRYGIVLEVGFGVLALVDSLLGVLVLPMRSAAVGAALGVF